MSVGLKGGLESIVLQFIALAVSTRLADNIIPFRTYFIKIFIKIQKTKEALDSKNSLKVHIIAPELNSKTVFTITDESSGGRIDWYYVRIIQKNGRLAWSSPIWIEKKV